jgi:hypothetical protein
MKTTDDPADSFSTIENTIDGLSVKIKAFILNFDYYIGFRCIT